MPAEWVESGRLWLRFDGLESIGRVWLNGVEIGILRGSRLRNELDVTGLVVGGENVLVVRVSQWSAMSCPVSTSAVSGSLWRVVLVVDALEGIVPVGVVGEA